MEGTRSRICPPWNVLRMVEPRVSLHRSAEDEEDDAPAPEILRVEGEAGGRRWERELHRETQRSVYAAFYCSHYSQAINSAQCIMLKSCVCVCFTCSPCRSGVETVCLCWADLCTRTCSCVSSHCQGCYSTKHTHCNQIHAVKYFLSTVILSNLLHAAITATSSSISPPLL